MIEDSHPRPGRKLAFVTNPNTYSPKEIKEKTGLSLATIAKWQALIAPATRDGRNWWYDFEQTARLLLVNEFLLYFPVGVVLHTLVPQIPPELCRLRYIVSDGNRVKPVDLANPTLWEMCDTSKPASMIGKPKPRKRYGALGTIGIDVLELLARMPMRPGSFREMTLKEYLALDKAGRQAAAQNCWAAQIYREEKLGFWFGPLGIEARLGYHLPPAAVSWNRMTPRAAVQPSSVTTAISSRN
jgi:hypothetical protein